MAEASAGEAGWNDHLQQAVDHAADPTAAATAAMVLGLALSRAQRPHEAVEGPRPRRRLAGTMHANCPFPEERMKLAESLYEEETGRISGCNVSHPELFIRFGESIGVPRAAMVDGVPLPATAALIDWFEQSTRRQPFIEGSAATNLAAEGQVPGAFGPFARRSSGTTVLARRGRVLGHPRAGRRGAQRDRRPRRRAPGHRRRSSRPACGGRVARSLELWWQFFDGIQAAL